MPLSEIALIFRWITPLWAFGWLVLPFSSRLFPFLPDKGLAAGRVVSLALLSLAAFWGAATHLVPLSFAPFALIVAPLVAAIGWKDAAFRARISSNRRQLLLCDAVFLFAFGFFLWVRLRHPEANDLEKPMDMALLSAAMRAEFLPFQNPYLAGEAFSNYYYFGPLMAANLARALQTPPYLAYNLVQPFFCALFISTLWSLSASLAKSSVIGLVVTFLVALGGHFEPLRQIAQSGQIWPLDWWKTSRVIENTINEYPAFTMLTGDLHAHFYAFSLAATFFCLCFGVLKAESPRLREVLLLLGGVFLGIFALTNTWDVPLYGILLLWCALESLPSRQRGDKFLLLCVLGLPVSVLFFSKMAPSASVGLWLALIFVILPLEILGWRFLVGSFKNLPRSRRREIMMSAAPFLMAPLVALPYFLKFKAQVSGVVFDLWVPNLASFALLWGSWWQLSFFTLQLPGDPEKTSVEAIFRRFLIGVGIVALLFPFVFYLRGAFGDGAFRHQDTVFKFGLQAWLLLGTGLAAQAGFRLRKWWRGAIWPFKFAAATTMAAFFALVSLAPLCVAWTRTLRDATRDERGDFLLSLNAARFVPPDELAGIEWLRRNAKPGDSVVEFVKRDPKSGAPLGDYEANVGRIAAFSGVPSVLGWPQHAAAWGGSWEDINRRAALVNEIYGAPNSKASLESLRESGATFVFLGAPERAQNGALTKLKIEKDGLTIARKSGKLPQILRFEPPLQSN